MALGELTPSYVRDNYLKKPKEDDEEMWRKKAEELEEKFKTWDAEKKEYELNTQKTIDKLREALGDKDEILSELQLRNKTQKESIKQMETHLQELQGLEEFLGKIRGQPTVDFTPFERRLGYLEEKVEDLYAQFGRLNLELEHEPVKVEVKETEIKTVSMTTRTQEGKILYAALNDKQLIDLSLDGWTEADLQKALQEWGWTIKHQALAPRLAGLVKKGLLVRIGQTRGKYLYRFPSKVPIEASKA